MWRAPLSIALILAACGGPSKKTTPPPADTDPAPEAPAVSALCQPLDELTMQASFVGYIDLEGEEIEPTKDGETAYRSTLSLPGVDCIVVPFAHPDYVECRLASATDAAELQERFEQTAAEITGCLDPELWAERDRTETSLEMFQSGLQEGLVVAVDREDDGSYTLRILIVNVP